MAELGEGKYAVLVRLDAEGRGSGTPVTSELTVFYELVDGLIARAAFEPGRSPQLQSYQSISTVVHRVLYASVPDVLSMVHFTACVPWKPSTSAGATKTSSRALPATFVSSVATSCWNTVP